MEYNYVYGALNSTQQQAVNDLGMDEDQWDCFMHHYEENLNWQDLPERVQLAFEDLGWNECSYSGEPDCPAPASELANWRQLNSTERAAAIQLCWFRSSWDGDPLPW